MLRSNNVHSAQGNLHPQWGSSSVDDGDVMVMEAKATEVSSVSGANQHWSVRVGKRHILAVPPPPPLYMVSSTFCIVSGFIYLFIFITGMQNMPKACSSRCHLYSIKTSHLILMLAQERQGAFPVQGGVRNTQSEREQQETAWESRLTTTRH